MDEGVYSAICSYCEREVSVKGGLIDKCPYCGGKFSKDDEVIFRPVKKSRVARMVIFALLGFMFVSIGVMVLLLFF